MYAELTLKCSTCKTEKSVEAFSARKDRPRGYESRCKECNSKRALKYHTENRSDVLPKMRLRASIRYSMDPTKQRVWSRCSKLRYVKQMPKWQSMKELFNFYMACPKGMEVDHIVPLKGKTVSGLHVINNLQYLSKQANAKKHNTWKS